MRTEPARCDEDGNKEAEWRRSRGGSKPTAKCKSHSGSMAGETGVSTSMGLLSVAAMAGAQAASEQTRLTNTEMFLSRGALALNLRAQARHVAAGRGGRTRRLLRRSMQRAGEGRAKPPIGKKCNKLNTECELHACPGSPPFPGLGCRKQTTKQQKIENQQM